MEVVHAGADVARDQAPREAAGVQPAAELHRPRHEPHVPQSLHEMAARVEDRCHAIAVVSGRLLFHVLIDDHIAMDIGRSVRVCLHPEPRELFLPNREPH